MPSIQPLALLEKSSIAKRYWQQLRSAGFCSLGRWRLSELLQAAISAACFISFPRQVGLSVVVYGAHLSVQIYRAHLAALVYRAHLPVRQSLEEKGLVRAGNFSVRRWRKGYASG